MSTHNQTYSRPTDPPSIVEIFLPRFTHISTTIQQLQASNSNECTQIIYIVKITFFWVKYAVSIHNNTHGSEWASIISDQRGLKHRGDDATEPVFLEVHTAIDLSASYNKAVSEISCDKASSGISFNLANEHFPNTKVSTAQLAILPDNPTAVPLATVNGEQEKEITKEPSVCASKLEVEAVNGMKSGTQSSTNTRLWEP
ncbi:hypothetical protein B7494_g933 [Chlorociboria aeruginascens]|nr:hypothetical protein B7494_g933 [Chlorociboria aeruginascens]